jgi:hypothetical protein
MQVLVVESEPGAAALAIEDLERAGHTVHRCHRPGAPAFPCVALESGDCPLESEGIDAVVTVRGASGIRPTPLEDGVSCALRRRIPVVVAGRTAVHPFETFEASTTTMDDLVGACERARDTLTLHRAVARDALVVTLERAGIDAHGVDAEVVRRDGRLLVRLVLPPQTPAGTRQMAAVRVTGALRKFDQYAGGIDVEPVVTERPAAAER